MATEAAITQAEQNADQAWKEAALDAVQACATKHAFFTSDDVWAFIPEGFLTHENRAFGAVIRRAIKAGWMIPTGQFQKSLRVTNHSTYRPLWKSLIASDEEACSVAEAVVEQGVVRIEEKALALILASRKTEGRWEQAGGRAVIWSRKRVPGGPMTLEFRAEVND
jgi:hypothetical protein